MAAYIVEDVLQDVASYVNNDNNTPTGTELTTWINFVNQAQNEWASSYEWKLLREYEKPTFGLSLASLPIPTRFKNFMSPIYDRSLTTDNKYGEIRPEERFDKLSTDRYITRLGNIFLINPALVSGASLGYDYQAYPSSLATLNDTITCPSRQFITQRTISKVLGGRSDGRFTIVKAESDDLLANMIEDEATKSGAMENETPNYLKKAKFTLGVD